jgi:hypothetical protein
MVGVHQSALQFDDAVCTVVAHDELKIYCGLLVDN